jgi:hypothetical protein
VLDVYEEMMMNWLKIGSLKHWHCYGKETELKDMGLNNLNSTNLNKQTKVC